MRRLYFVQLWNHFSDEATEDALYDRPILARLVGIDRLRERVPDATTLMNFRHLLEAHQLAPRILERVNARLEAQGLLLREGTLVEARWLPLRPRPRTRISNATPRCTRPRRATNGISA